MSADPNQIDRLADALADDPSDNFVRRLIALVSEELGLDIAYVSEFTDTDQVFRMIEGDPSSFSMEEGGSVPLPETYCRRVVSGEIPSLIADAQTDGRVNDLSSTLQIGIGSYVGIPIRFSDGRLYGTLCTISHDAAPHLRERDLGFVKIVARMVGDVLEREELARQRWMLEIEAAGMGALLAALEARDGYTGEHSAAVVELCEAVAEILGFDDQEVARVKQVALLHDIGKVGIPDAILRKEAPLEKDEWVIMKTHPEIGRTIVEATPSLAHLGPAIGAEHERWDGRGYPKGLKGEDIPFESRIVLACDAWHAMTSDRPYRKAMTPEAATRELIRGAGTQFDRAVVGALNLLLKSDGTMDALQRYRHDKNNLAQLIEFRNYLTDGDAHLLEDLDKAIAESESALREIDSEEAC